MKLIIASTLIFIIISMAVNISAAPLKENNIESGIATTTGCFDSTTTSRSPFCDRN